jgi:hypothetical protein
MRKGLLLLAGVALLTTSLVAQAAQTAKPATPQTAKPAAPQTAKPATPAAPFKPASERKEIKLTEKVLKTYVGEYQMGPDRILTVTLKDGYLWGQPTGQDARQMFPETQTVFFLKDIPYEVTFKKDAKGAVTGMSMRQDGGPVRELAKIK